MPPKPQRPQRSGVMLAYPAEENRVKHLGDWFYIQPKLNGERCRVEEFRGEPVLLSSYENEFKFVNHLKEEIHQIWKTHGPLPFDGEIYVHGWDRERIDSALRRTVNESPDTQHLELHIFDYVCPEINQGERLADLHRITNWTKHLKLVPTYKADFSNWSTFTDIFIEAGYEGSILRGHSAPYTPVRRPHMLKYKPTAYDDYTIVDVEEAIDKNGERKGMVGAFWVQGDDETVFKVGAGKLTHQKRIEYWNAGNTIINKQLRVKHGIIYTSGNIPTCAVAVEVLL